MTNKELDHILDSAFKGPLRQKERAALLEIVSEMLNECEFEWAGTLIPEEAIPELDEDSVHVLDSYLRDERVEHLTNGAVPTKEEEVLFRAAWLYRAAAGDGDADDIPGLNVVRLAHSDGREVQVAVLTYGYSFTEVRQELLGPFVEEESLLKAVRAEGFLDRDLKEPSTELIESARNSTRRG